MEPHEHDDVGGPASGVARISVLVVEDDPTCQRIILGLIARLPNLELIGLASDAEQALTFLRKGTVDLMFLDVWLPGLSGFELLATLAPKPVVVITTSDPGHAIEAFRLGVTDLIIKPCSFERFLLAVDRSATVLAGRPARVSARTGGNTTDRLLSLPSGRRSLRIPVRSIRLVEAHGNQVRITLDDRIVSVKCTMQRMEELLCPDGFTRVHRSIIVADRIVKDLDRETLFTEGGEIAIGDSYAKEVRRKFRAVL